MGAPMCLNCGAPLAGAYCTACGQRAIDLAAPTWHIVREVLTDATDLDGRVLRTVRALVSPGRLTAEFLRGRRAPYIGPLKLFLLAGTALSTTWLVTRGVDAHYYGIAADRSAGTYIDTVVRGSVASGLAIAVSSWVLAGGRRRFLDETVFALYLVAALSLLATVVIWLGTAWKLAWGTNANVPQSLPSLLYLLFFPTLAIALVYIVGSIRRIHGGAWWTTAIRALILTVVGVKTVLLALSHFA